MTPIEVGITGGIGSGKTIVSQVLHTMQYPVYDTDTRAKTIMGKPAVRKALVEAWGTSIIQNNGEIDRAKLASIVFSNPAELTRLNNIVHPAVINDYQQWVQQQQSAIVFVESAILHQSGMDSTLHHIWIVEADTETRIKRVMQRNNISRQEVEARIATQQQQPADHRTHTIINDNTHAVLPQIIHLLSKLLT
ncbi:MAG: dephospho-CoA kinase [Bacteroidaceae bacterium]|nr:dephospho-CoA kinase [Bacteroidaceae bacterium]